MEEHGNEKYRPQWYIHTSTPYSTLELADLQRDYHNDYYTNYYPQAKYVRHAHYRVQVLSTPQRYRHMNRPSLISVSGSRGRIEARTSRTYSYSLALGTNMSTQPVWCLSCTL